MDILLIKVKDQCAAVCKLTAEGQPLFSGQRQQRLFTELSQISCDDQIKITVTGMQVIKVRFNGCKGSRG